MSELWTPGPLSDMSAAERREADAVGRAFIEVTGYLRANDDAGAHEYLGRFLTEHGQFAHDTVMQLIQNLTRSPDWRTFS